MWIYFLLTGLNLGLFALCFYKFILVDDLADCMDHPHSVCSLINQWTPLLVGSQWLMTLLHLLLGHPFLTLFALPVTILYVHQYSQRVADSGLGFHNPIRFFSKKHLQGLSSVYLLLCCHYLLWTGLYLCLFLISLRG